MSKLRIHDPDNKPKTDTCTLCCRPRIIRWFLKSYFGLSGKFCYHCYDSVSHRSEYADNGDVVWKPKNPDRYYSALRRYNESRQKEQVKLNE